MPGQAKKIYSFLLLTMGNGGNISGIPLNRTWWSGFEKGSGPGLPSGALRTACGVPAGRQGCGGSDPGPAAGWRGDELS